MPSTDTYIEKDSSINDEIDRMRHAATHALLTRNDVIIVASVSCIYGLGTAEAYFGLLQQIEKGQEFLRDRFIRSLVDIQYERNDIDFHRGTFRVRGDTVEVFPPYEESRAVRIEFFGDVVERISEFDPLRGLSLAELDKVAIFPNSHYVSAPEVRHRAIQGVRDELLGRLQELRGANKLVEAQRLEQRTHVRPGDARADGLLLRHRELLALALRPASRGAASVPPRLLPEGLPARRRRVAPDRAPGRRHVPRRPEPEGDARRARLPAPLGARQPAAPLRGVRGARRAGHLRVGHAGRLRAREVRRGGGGADHPSHRPRRSRGGGAAGRHAGGRPARPRCGSAPRPASGCS